MSDPVVQIIARRPDGSDPRALGEFEPMKKQLEAIEVLRKAKDYPGAKLRPNLAFQLTSGAIIEPEQKTSAPNPDK